VPKTLPWMLNVFLLMLCFSGTGARASNRTESPSLEGQFVARLRTSFAERMDLPADIFDVRAENLVFFPPLPLGLARQPELLDVMGIGSAGASRIDGLFTMSVTLKYPDGTVREHQVSGLMQVSGPVWVAKQTLNRGHVLAADDLAMQRLPWSQLATGVALTRKDELVGRASRSLIQVGAPLYAAVLEIAPSVKTGDLVELTVQSGPGVMIRSRAVARQTGRVGDFIRVEQSDTRKPLQALVTGDKTVEVQL